MTITQKVQPFIWHPDGRRVLQCGDGWPVLELREGQKVAEALEVAWGLEVWTLHDGGLSVGRNEQSHIQALSDGVPDGMHWTEADVPLLPNARPWQLPGWPAQAQVLLRDALTARDISECGEPQVLSTTDLDFILWGESTAGPVFLKVSDSPREAGVTAFLSSTLPELLPPVSWSDPASNSLLTRSGGALLEGVNDLNAWTGALRRLAQFQRQADAAALAALGCPSFSLLEMAERVDSLLADTDTLRAWGLEEDRRATLNAARPAIRAAFRELATLNLPDLPAHGDAHPRNALSGERGPVWFDWSEAATAAHPFMDVGWFLAFTFHPARAELPIRTAHPDLEKCLSGAYLSALGCPDAALLLSRAVPLALLHRAVIYDARFRNWEGTLPGWRPNFVPYYLRLAAREMVRLPS